MSPNEYDLPRLFGALGVLAAVSSPASPAWADEVVVQGRPLHSSRDPTAASSVISRERLERPGATASTVLQSVPGAEVQRTGAASDLATASLRGATSAQTPVYLAGVRLNDDVTGTADLSTVPLTMLDRVEIFRGNGPEYADQLGPGGAVFFEPRLPRASEALGGVLLGSYGARAAWFSAGLAAPGSAALLAVRRDAAANSYPYTDDGGTRFDVSDDREVTRKNADFESYDVWAIGRHALGSGGRLVSILEAFDREQGVTGLGSPPALRARARTRRELLALSSSVPCRAGAQPEACRVEIVTSAIRARSAIEDPGYELSLSSDFVSSTGTRLSQRGRLSLALAESIAVGLGIEQSIEALEVLRHQALADFDLRASREETRASGSGRLELGRVLTLYGLGAFERRCVQAEGDARCAEVEPSGRFGATLSFLSGLSAHGNVSATTRAPLLSELYGVAPLVRGNPALRPERGSSVELGLRATSRVGRARGSLEAFAFRRGVRQLIAYTSSFRQTVPYNVGRARFSGVELAGRGELGSVLRTDLALTLLEPRDVTSGRTLVNDTLPFHSRAVLSARAEVGIDPRLPNIERVGAALGVRHRAGRYADRAGLIVVPSDSSFDLEAQAELLARRLIARVAIDDVFDTARWDFVGAPLPGRTAYASVEAKLP